MLQKIKIFEIFNKRRRGLDVQFWFALRVLVENAYQLSKKKGKLQNNFNNAKITIIMRLQNVFGKCQEEKFGDLHVILIRDYCPAHNIPSEVIPKQENLKILSPNLASELKMIFRLSSLIINYTKNYYIISMFSLYNDSFRIEYGATL